MRDWNRRTVKRLKRRTKGRKSLFNSILCSILSELMLPDGAHLRAEDWTIFCLNQLTPDPHQDVEKEEKTEGKPLLYVLNLVRTKHDATARR